MNIFRPFSRALPRALAALALAFAVPATGDALAQHDATVPVYRAGNWRSYNRQFNAHISAAAAALNRGDAKLVFVGDSITENWAKAGASVWSARYAKFNPVNLGMSADRTQNILFRLDKLPLSASKPKVVVLLAGFNNISSQYDGRSSPENTADGIKEVVLRLKKAWPAAKILVLHVFPAGKPDSPDRKKINQINALLPARLRAERNVTLLDISPKFLASGGALRSELYADGVHLSARGYQTWAAAMAPALEKLFR